MVVISITFTSQQIASEIYFLDFYKDKNVKLHNFFCSTNRSGDSYGSTSPTNNTSFQSQMKMLWKITDQESFEISQENFYDDVSFSKNTNLQCSNCNFAIKRTHHRCFQEYLPKTSYLKKNKKRKSLFFFSEKSLSWTSTLIKLQSYSTQSPIFSKKQSSCKTFLQKRGKF